VTPLRQTNLPCLSLRSPSSDMPYLQLVFSCPCCLTIEHPPLATKLPLSSRPNPYDRRHNGSPKPLISLCHKCAPPRNSLRSMSHTSCMVPLQVRTMSLLGRTITIHRTNQAFFTYLLVFLFGHPCPSSLQPSDRFCLCLPVFTLPLFSPTEHFCGGTPAIGPYPRNHLGLCRCKTSLRSRCGSPFLV